MTPSDDVTAEGVVCPACGGRSDPPPNGITLGMCWLCLDARIVTRTRAAEFERVSREDVTPVVHTAILPQAMPSRPRDVGVWASLPRSWERVAYAIALAVLVIFILAWCNP